MEARRQASLASQRVYTIELGTDQGSWGRVLEQQPAAGAAPAPDGILVLTVGARPNVTVPDVRGRVESEALATLRDAGLGATRRVIRHSDKVPEGHVIRTRPRAGAEVPAGSHVSCIVADAPRPSGRERRGERGRVRAVRPPDGSFQRSSDT
jgi:beta-lactam-binding protein with PASTA domain